MTYFTTNRCFCFPEAFDLRKALIAHAPPASFAVSKTWSASMDVILVMEGCICSWKTETQDINVRNHIFKYLTS